MKKPGRNDPCVCGSGKKFKKCCERKMIGKKFMATKIEPAVNTPSNIASFFQQKITQITPTKKSSEQASKPIKSDIKKKQDSNDQKVLINSTLNQENVNNS